MSKFTLALFTFLFAFFTLSTAVAEEQKAAPPGASIKATEQTVKSKTMKPTDRLGSTIAYSFFL